MTSGASYHRRSHPYNHPLGRYQQTRQPSHLEHGQTPQVGASQYIIPQYNCQSFGSPLTHWNPIHMAGLNQGEMEDFQRLSDQYQPDLPGPLVGDKLSISKLVEEYTTADPTYVAKTLALAATYTGYRRIKGDGQCGWRGAVFGYFEKLLQIGDLQLVMQEEVRLQSYEETMRMAGIDYDIIVEMFDFTWDLFANLKRAVERQDTNESVLLEPLNDEIKSNSIVYHFKMMTSAFLQLNPDGYEPFLEMSIADYRVRRIDPANQEIDQVGLQILTDGVIAQAGFAVDVLYLDRSYGDEVTPHEFAPRNQGAPTIRLLYRPGHYDMIYKEDQQPIQVFLQQNNPLPQSMEMAYNYGLTSDQQAYLFAGPQSNQGLGTSDQFSYNPSSSNAPQQSYTYQDSTCYQVPPTLQHELPQAGLAHDYQQLYPPQFSSPCVSTVASPSGPTTPAMAPLMSPPAFSMKPKDDKIRYVEIIQELGQNYESVPLSSQSFGNAASSPAHFRNQEFQPQMWNADEDLR